MLYLCRHSCWKWSSLETHSKHMVLQCPASLRQMPPTALPTSHCSIRVELGNETRSSPWPVCSVSAAVLSPNLTELARSVKLKTCFVRSSSDVNFVQFTCHMFLFGLSSVDHLANYMNLCLHLLYVIESKASWQQLWQAGLSTILSKSIAIIDNRYHRKNYRRHETPA